MYSVRLCLGIFMRDGWIYRYSGQQLVIPGALRLLSLTLDHVVPVARGGTEDADNLVTPSMLRSAAKGLWTLDELGWRLLPPGNPSVWDGMRGWFVDYLGKNPQHLSNG